ncbi:hypothetical protein CSPAE12_07539 [Colletotrichum incanum]|nr:hypothetical protein CSPAE12_07539 [Colletotrichum incanum]
MSPLRFEGHHSTRGLGLLPARDIQHRYAPASQRRLESFCETAVRDPIGDKPPIPSRLDFRGH